MILQFFRRFERVIRYVIVGSGVTTLYTGIVAALVSYGLVPNPTLAAAIASIAVLPVSYVGHRSITYADTPSSHAQWARFAATAIVTFILNTGLMNTADQIGWSYWTALCAGWVIVPIVNYMVNAIWVFRTKKLFGLDRGAP